MHFLTNEQIDLMVVISIFIPWNFLKPEWNQRQIVFITIFIAGQNSFVWQIIQLTKLIFISLVLRILIIIKKTISRNTCSQYYGVNSQCLLCYVLFHGLEFFIIHGFVRYQSRLFSNLLLLSIYKIISSLIVLISLLSVFYLCILFICYENLTWLPPEYIRIFDYLLYFIWCFPLNPWTIQTYDRYIKSLSFSSREARDEFEFPKGSWNQRQIL